LAPIFDCRGTEKEPSNGILAVLLLIALGFFFSIGGIREWKGAEFDREQDVYHVSIVKPHIKRLNAYAERRKVIVRWWYFPSHAFPSFFLPILRACFVSNRKKSPLSSQLSEAKIWVGASCILYLGFC
jgi:hypothetical protein